MTNKIKINNPSLEQFSSTQRITGRMTIHTEQIDYLLYFEIQIGNFENDIRIFSGFQKNQQSDTFHIHIANGP